MRDTLQAGIAGQEIADRDIAGRDMEWTQNLEEEMRAAEPELEPEHNVYDIVIPVFNALDETSACIESVVTHTDAKHTIHLIDDASPDERVEPALRSLANRWPQVRYVRLPENRGFAAAVNAGLESTSNDVVVLNSDTLCTPGWLARMDRCRRSDPRIHVVSPLSNNATICSVPHFNRDNKLPDGVTPTRMAALVAATSLRRYPRVPTVVGFCMLMTREAIQRVGYLDSDTFGRGYGEEVDWCQRAWGLGLESALCDDAYVFHAGEASFSKVAEKAWLQQRSQRRISRLWPEYYNNVMAYCLINPLRLQQQRLGAQLRRQTGDRRPSVLHVCHNFNALGGVELHTREIALRLRQRFQPTVLYPATLTSWCDAVTVEDANGILHVRMNRRLVPSDVFFQDAPAALASRTVERFFAEFLAGAQPDVVHFQHLLFYGSLALPCIARSMGFKVVLSLHDYFLLCPDWNLIGPSGGACGKAGLSTADDCKACIASKGHTTEASRTFDLEAYARERHVRARQALEAAHRIVAPSRFVADLFATSFGNDLGRKIEVVAHGVRPMTPSTHGRRESAELRVGFLGHLTEPKGRTVFLDCVKQLQHRDIRFRVFGHDPGDAGLDAPQLEIYGRYAPEELPDLLQQVDVVAILSIWHETYCLTLDEALRAGVPVIASRIGALQERVQHGVTGFLIEPGDANALAATIRRLDQDRALLARLRANAGQLTVTSIEANMERYAALYDGLRTQAAASCTASARKSQPSPPSGMSALIRDRMLKSTRRSVGHLEPRA